MSYIDLDDTHQIIVYSKELIIDEENLTIVGKLVKVKSKKGESEYKIHDEFSEYQIITDSWNCSQND